MEMEFIRNVRKSIDICADDFGKSQRANRNTLHLVTLGKIDRVAVMINGTIDDKEIGELIKAGVRIDLHLDIERIATESSSQHSSTRRMLDFACKYASGRLSTKKIDAKWRRQIEQFKERFGKLPDGINSHEHVHFFPPYFKLLLKILSDYPVPYVRFGTKGTLPADSTVPTILRVLQKWDERMFNKVPFVSSDYVSSLDWIKDAHQFWKNLPSGKTELICHPERAEEFARLRQEF